jgi:hypothetical protein
MLELVQLQRRYVSLQDRTKKARNAQPAVSASEAEGYELQEAVSAAVGSTTAVAGPEVEIAEKETNNVQDERVALRKEWDAWQTALMVNS